MTSHRIYGEGGGDGGTNRSQTGNKPDSAKLTNMLTHIPT